MTILADTSLLPTQLFRLKVKVSYARSTTSPVPHRRPLSTLCGRQGAERKSGGPGLAAYSICFCLQYFVKVKSLICLEGKFLLIGQTLLFLPATPLSPSRTLDWLFELTCRPSRALDSPRALLPELQRYKDTRCGALGAEVPGHC